MEQKIKSLIETLEYELVRLDEGMDGIDAFDHVAINTKKYTIRYGKHYFFKTKDKR